MLALRVQAECLAVPRGPLDQGQEEGLGAQGSQCRGPLGRGRPQEALARTARVLSLRVQRAKVPRDQRGAVGEWRAAFAGDRGSFGGRFEEHLS